MPKPSACQTARTPSSTTIGLQAQSRLAPIGMAANRTDPQVQFLLIARQVNQEKSKVEFVDVLVEGTDEPPAIRARLPGHGDIGGNTLALRIRERTPVA